MAVYGIGIDLIEVERIVGSLARFGDRFSRRVFTAEERRRCDRGRRRGACYALRFAAKEAFAKALGLGLRRPVLWQDIEVTNDPLGKPEIRLSERAASYCRGLGIHSWHLSLTDDGRYGAAVVILETQSEQVSC
ncbi:MAG: holo-[acyl-carrier-protein] synthase [Syntrophobacteraceae bacterium CG2_30_61_12]|nr:MAG: holo-[acyl-carrier-protein] synthase [Syntrophobacteraceae bacterium CG2_30_61_12]PIU31328.1 MAG: hypothetical protein COT06_08740 [Syntrophobacteraceae bacterium CG07_land_8_20_14_0_80_61_8]